MIPPEEALGPVLDPPQVRSDAVLGDSLPPTLMELARPLARLVGEGHSAIESARALGVSLDTAERIFSWSGFLDLVKEVIPTREEMRLRIAAVAPRALDKAVHLMENAESDKTKASMAKLLLEIDGYTPVKRIATVSISLSAEQAGLLGLIAQNLGTLRRPLPPSDEGGS